MTREGFIALAIGLSACGFASPRVAGAEDAMTTAAVPAVNAPSPEPTWQLGLRAGWGLSAHSQGDLDSELFVGDFGAHLLAESGFSKSVNEVDLAIDVLTPWSFGIVRPFATFGGGLAVGDNENTGGITALPLTVFTGGGPLPPGFPDSIVGLTDATLEDIANFYMRIGGDLAFPMPGAGSTASFHVRPYVGFDVRAYRGTLGIHPSVLVPILGANAGIPPDQEAISRFTRVSPLAGAEVVIPLCSHECWGVDVYFGGEYQFNVGGKHSIFRDLSDTGSNAGAYANVSGGNVARVFAGLQYHFNLGGN